MKAKYYIGILSALLLTGVPAKAQYSDNVYPVNDGARIIVNNYYDHDYFYSSRINRFHRSYIVFDYYSPFFTDTYWYSYRPFTWGLSIYRSGLGFTVGYNFYYPLYYGHNYYYDYGWYNPFYYSYNYYGFDPYYYSSYYWGYDPFFYSYWSTPVVFNIGYMNGWAHHNWRWDKHYYRNHYYGWNSYRPVYYSNNNHYDYNRPTKYSTKNNSASYESRRPATDLNSRQSAMPSDDRRSSANRSNKGIMPDRIQESKSIVNRQPESRRSTSQPIAGNSNRSMTAAVQGLSASRRESALSTSRTSSSLNSRSSAAVNSSTNDSRRRK